MRKSIFAAFAFTLLHFSAAAQHDAKKAEKVKIFLDCTRSWLCDYDYVRTEMKMVEFVRDRFVSDVHILVNTQFSSSGGEQNQINFMGQKRFPGIIDTLTYFNDPTVTDDDKRKKLVRYLKLGLVRYIAKTDAGKDLEIGYTKSDSSMKEEKAEAKKDKWNYWVYQFGGSASFNGNQNSRSSSTYGYINADRETEEWKTNFYVSYNKSVSVFIQNSVESKFNTKDFSGGMQIAKSINKHWSYGFGAGFENELARNLKSAISIRPKLEYSFIPYSKFNSERIVLQYMLGPEYNNYYDTTAFYKTNELQLQQSLNLITSFNKPWGNINFGIFYSNYFDRISKNNLSFNGAVNWKISKGLLFGVYGYYSLVNDQIALRKDDATRDQLLTGNRELKSSFEYNLGFGFSYRFGSIANSIVNPRFKGLSYSVNF
jgi:hypothetical protein